MADELMQNPHAPSAQEIADKLMAEAKRMHPLNMPGPEMITMLTESGEFVVNWPVVERLAQAWDLGVRDHLNCQWCKVLVSLREQMRPRVAPVELPAEMKSQLWRPAGWSQLADAGEELKDPAVVGVAIVLMRLNDTASSVLSKAMYSSAMPQGIVQQAVQQAADDFGRGKATDIGKFN